MDSKETIFNTRTSELLSLGFVFDLFKFKSKTFSISTQEVKQLDECTWRKMLESFKKDQK